MKRYFQIFVLLLIFSFGSTSFAYAQGNIGFLDNSIWYSQIPKVEGESVKVYTAIWNGSGSEISSHVEFYDGTTLLGSRDIKISAENISEVFIVWKVTAGDHNINAKITKSTSLTSGVAKNISIASSATEGSKISILKKEAVDSGATTPVDTIVKKVTESLPATVATPVAGVALKVDNFRENTRVNIDSEIKEVTSRLDELNAPSKTNKNTTQKKPTNSLSGTEKPIAYIEIFLLKLASYVFTQKVLFYGIGALFAFFVLRFLYRLIRAKK